MAISTEVQDIRGEVLRLYFHMSAAPRRGIARIDKPNDVCLTWTSTVIGIMAEATLHG